MNSLVRSACILTIIAGSAGVPRAVTADELVDHSGPYQLEVTYRGGDATPCPYNGPPGEAPRTSYAGAAIQQSGNQWGFTRLEATDPLSALAAGKGSVSPNGSFEIKWEEPEPMTQPGSRYGAVVLAGRFDLDTFVGTGTVIIAQQMKDNASVPVRGCTSTYDARLVPGFTPWACDLFIRTKRLEVLQDSVRGVARMGHGDEWNVTSGWEGRPYSTVFHTGGLPQGRELAAGGGAIDEHPDAEDKVFAYRMHEFPFTRLLSVAVQQHIFEYGPTGVAEDGSFIPGGVTGEFDLRGETQVAVPMAMGPIPDLPPLLRSGIEDAIQMPPLPSGCAAWTLRDLAVVVQGFDLQGNLPFEVRITYDFQLQRRADSMPGAAPTYPVDRCAVGVSLRRLEVLEDPLDLSFDASGLDAQNRWTVTSQWESQTRATPVYSGGRLIGRDLAWSLPEVDNLTDTVALASYPKTAFPLTRPLSVNVGQHVWEYAVSSEGPAGGFNPRAVTDQFDRVGRAEVAVQVACPGRNIDTVVVRGAAEGGGAEFTVRLTYETEASEIR